MSSPPALIIHSLPHLRAALAPGLPVTLLSAPGAADYAGPAWWAALLRAGGHTGPSLLDCASSPGRALEALTLHLPGLILRPCPAWGQLAALARAQGAVLLTAPPPALNLGAPGAAWRLTPWLRGEISPIPAPRP
jgi:hypothetical protein